MIAISLSTYQKFDETTKICQKNQRTFIRTLSLSFSLFIIFIATFLPVTQCTPSLTRPEKIIKIPEWVLKSIDLVSVIKPVIW